MIEYNSWANETMGHGLTYPLIHDKAVILKGKEKQNLILWLITQELNLRKRKNFDGNIDSSPYICSLTSLCDSMI